MIARGKMGDEAGRGKGETIVCKSLPFIVYTLLGASDAETSSLLHP